MKVVILLLVATPLSVSAQDLVWPPLGTQELRENVGVEAVDAVVAGLEASGRRVQRLGVDSVGVEEPCTEPNCIREKLDEHGAERGIFVAVWARAGRARVSEISVTIRSERDEQSGRADVQGDVADAARRALATALSASRSYALRVTSAPTGAALTLDGSPAGTAPVDLEVSQGSHVVSAALDGYEPERRTLEIAQDSEVHFALNAVEASSTPNTPTGPSPFNYVLAGGLFVAGVSLLVPNLITVARNGECRSGCASLDDGRFQRYDVGGRTIGLLVLAGALLISAEVVLFRTLKKRRQTRVTASVGTQSAQLRLDSTF